MKKLLVLIGLICLFVIPTANAKPQAVAYAHGHVYFGANFGGGVVPNATVTLSGSCGGHTYHTNSAGRWPSDAALVVNAPCNMTVQASSGNCTVYYSDPFSITLSPNNDYEFSNYETHSVRVCNRPEIIG